jgi:hypothetical protein
LESFGLGVGFGQNFGFGMHFGFGFGMRFGFGLGMRFGFGLGIGIITSIGFRRNFWFKIKPKTEIW